MASRKSKQSESTGVRITGVEILEDEIGPAIRDERLIFLYAAAEHPAIRLADSLRSEVHARVLALPQSYWDHPFSPTAKAHHEELDGLIRSWAERFNLGVEWVVREAWTAINVWQMNPRTSNPFTWRSVYVVPPSFHFPPFLPQDDDAELYRSRVLRTFKKALDKYVEESMGRYRSHRLPAKRKREGVIEVNDRYTWAALRVCCPWSCERIARSIGHQITTRRIENVVRAVCVRIALPIPNLKRRKK